MMTFVKRISRSVSYRLDRWAIRRCERNEKHAISKTLDVPTSNEYSVNELRALKIYENYRRHFSRLVDVGANVGSFTRLISDCFELDEIFCIEPDESLARELKRNTPNHTVLVSCAVSSTEGRAELQLHPDRTMSSLNPIGKEFAELNSFYDSESIQKTEVNIKTLDDILTGMQPSSKRDLILKVDVQGHERDVLIGAPHTLERVSLLVIEHMFWDGYAGRMSHSELVSTLAHRGFEAREVVNVSYRKGRTSYVDYLFVHKDCDQ